jgi:hypothetical protein
MLATSGADADLAVSIEKSHGRIVTATEEATVKNEAQVVSLQNLQATVKPGSALYVAIQQYIDQLNAIPKSVYTNISYAGVHTPLVGKSAMGGPIPGNIPRLVGEKGPEIFVPNTAGTVIPNNQLGSMSNGGGGVGGVTNIFNISVPPNFDKAAFGRIIEEARSANKRTGGTLVS